MLFDIKNNRCLKLYKMSYLESKELINLFNDGGLHCFVNVVVEDSVLIYYGDFKNEAEETIYKELRYSPYRNYIKEELPERYGAAYLMTIDKSEKIDEIHKELELKEHIEDGIDYEDVEKDRALTEDDVLIHEDLENGYEEEEMVDNEDEEDSDELFDDDNLDDDDSIYDNDGFDNE